MRESSRDESRFRTPRTNCGQIYSLEFISPGGTSSLFTLHPATSRVQSSRHTPRVTSQCPEVERVEERKAMPYSDLRPNLCMHGFERHNGGR